MPNRINIPNWFQLDFDITNPKNTLGGISKLTTELSNQDLIDKWFYLFEGNTIRVRMHSKQPDKLEKAIKDNTTKHGLSVSAQHPFEGYWETDDAFEDDEVAEAFANTMASVTSLTIKRLEGKQFSNYRFTERLSHCIFNNVYGISTEEYFLLKRLTERLRISMGSLNDDPEQTAIDTNHKIGIIKGINLPTLNLKTPLK